MEKAALAGIGLVCMTVIVVGGLYYPHTLAGSVARFVFSLAA